MSVHVSKSGSHLIRVNSPGIRVRKASAGGGGAFSPTQIAGLDGWWDFSALGLADGTAITTVTDGSGNARSLSNAPNSSPVFKTAIQNGKGVARFDGTASALHSAAWTPGAAVTAFVVCRPSTTTGNQQVFAHAGGATWASPFMQYGIRQSGTGTWQSWRDTAAASAFAAGTVSTTAFKDICIVCGSTANSESMFQDGVSVATASGGTPLAPSSQAFWVGAHQGSIASSEWYAGDIGEIIVYNTALSTTDRQSVEGYLRSKWATA